MSASSTSSRRSPSLAPTHEAPTATPSTWSTWATMEAECSRLLLAVLGCSRTTFTETATAPTISATPGSRTATIHSQTLL
jgi:hypothetical protein